MRGYVGAMGGTWKTVLRIALAAVLVVLATAGCGGSSQSDSPAGHGLPRALASAWAVQASTIAGAAAAGDGCRARRLAGSLRTAVISAGGETPPRLRTPLLEAVNSLADRIVCVAPPVTVTTTPQPKPKPHKHPDQHGHHGHGGPDQGDQS
jgi:hypothetical protein